MQLEWCATLLFTVAFSQIATADLSPEMRRMLHFPDSFAEIQSLLLI